MSRQGFVFGKILERRSGAAGLLGRDDRRQTRYPAEGVPLTSRSGEDSITDEGGRMLKLFLVMALCFCRCLYLTASSALPQPAGACSGRLCVSGGVSEYAF